MRVHYGPGAALSVLHELTHFILKRAHAVSVLNIPKLRTGDRGYRFASILRLVWAFGHMSSHRVLRQQMEAAGSAELRPPALGSSVLPDLGQVTSPA